MKKFLKKTYFVAVSTFLALVLSIVSFGTYRNEAKAEDDFISGVHGLVVESFVEAVLDDIVQNDGDLSTSAIIVDHQIAGTTNSEQNSFMSILSSSSQYVQGLKIIVQLGNFRYKDLSTNITYSNVTDLGNFVAVANREVYGMGIWEIDYELYYLFVMEQIALDQTDNDGAKKPVMYLIERDPIITGSGGLSAKVYQGVGLGFVVYSTEL